MFNNHNLPKSLINEAANLLGTTNKDFELPSELQDIVAEAARDYVMCPTQEDRKAIIEWHIDQVMDIKDVDTQVIVNFERAVEFTVVNEAAPIVAAAGRLAMQAAKNPVVQQAAADVVGGLIKKKLDPATQTNEAKEERSFGEKMRLMARKAGVRLGQPRAKKVEPPKTPTGKVPLVHVGPEPLPMNNSVDYSELIKALSELNEQELSAYFDIVTVGEGGMLSEEQAEDFYRALVQAEII